MAEDPYHEPFETLPEATRELHRALVSLIEELEAMDWYYQRAAATGDGALREVILHNAGEEAEHAMMVLEWIRRADPRMDAAMRTYLFRAGSILAAEAEATGRGEGARGEASAPGAGPAGARATLGSLRSRDGG